MRFTKFKFKCISCNYLFKILLWLLKFWIALNKKILFHWLSNLEAELTEEEEGKLDDQERIMRFGRETVRCMANKMVCVVISHPLQVGLQYRVSVLVPEGFTEKLSGTWRIRSLCCHFSSFTGRTLVQGFSVVTWRLYRETVRYMANKIIVLSFLILYR